MSNTRYLEVTSTYRDRSRYPLPAQFEMPISQTGQKSQITALDPVSNQAAITTWIGGRFTALASANTIVMTLDLATGIGTTSDQTTVIVTGVTGHLQTLENYYRNAVAIVVNSAGPPNVILARVRILSYKYLGADIVGSSQNRAEITFAGSIPVDTTAITFTVGDPTDVTPTINPLFFVPAGRVGENAYVNTILFNETRNQFRPINGYDNTTSIISIDTTKSPTSTSSSGPITSWGLTDTYSIRENSPFFCSTLTADITTNPSTKSSFLLPSATPVVDLTGSFLEINNTMASTDSNGAFQAGGTLTTTVQLAGAANGDDDFFVGCTIRVITTAAGFPGDESVITAYDGTTKIATLDPGFALAIAAADTYLITRPVEAKRIAKYVDDRGAATGSGVATSVNLPSTSSSVSNYYNNLYIRITSGAATGDIRLIQTYTVTTTAGVTTRTATPFTAFSAVVAAGDTYEIISGIVSPAFSYSISTQKFCLLQYSYDNFHPFVYSGSTVSQQEMVCYEIQLLDLILPNVTLNCGVGSRIAFYPYVYVELSNVSGASAGLNNILYSNNPNATKMLFRAGIDDVPNPINSSFVKLDGDGMTQTIKFKPNDNLKFSVRLPNGEIYQTVLQETTSPNAPNPLIQISALFSLRRL